MSGKKRKNEDDVRLGHDPLEWLEAAPAADQELSADQKPSAAQAAAVQAKTPGKKKAPGAKKSSGTKNSNAGKKKITKSVEQPSVTEDILAVAADNKAKSNELALPVKLIINDIEQLHRDWHQFLMAHEGKELLIKSAKVEMIDAAGLQLLLAFIKTATDEGSKQVALADSSEVLLKTFEDGGMKDFFAQYSTAVQE